MVPAVAQDSVVAQVPSLVREALYAAGLPKPSSLEGLDMYTLSYSISASSCESSPPCPWQPPCRCPSLRCQPLQLAPISRMIRYLSFDWFISLSTVSSRFIQVVACVRIAPLFMTKYYCILFTTFYLPIHLLIDLGLFLLFSYCD